MRWNWTPGIHNRSYVRHTLRCRSFEVWMTADLTGPSPHGETFHPPPHRSPETSSRGKSGESTKMEFIRHRRPQAIKLWGMFPGFCSLPIARRCLLRWELKRRGKSPVIIDCHWIYWQLNLTSIDLHSPSSFQHTFWIILLKAITLALSHNGEIPRSPRRDSRQS